MLFFKRGFHNFSVELKAVCNGRKDCADGSDEAQCESIAFGDNYLQDLPPIANSNLLKISIEKCFLKLLFFYRFRQYGTGC